MEDVKYCQSCAMPLAEDKDHGTNADGSKSEDYCVYCFKEGAFLSDDTMEQMIESCVPHMVSDTMTAEQAREQMQQNFPSLKRWAK